MPVLGLKVDTQAAACDFTTATNARLAIKNMIKNPFSGTAFIKATAPAERVIIINLTPIYPGLGYIGLFSFIGLAALAYFFGLWGLYIPAGFIAVAYFIHSKYFFYLVAWAGLRKQGYIGRPRLLTDAELIKCLLERAL